jgi:hypothetical protein
MHGEVVCSVTDEHAWNTQDEDELENEIVTPALVRDAPRLAAAALAGSSRCCSLSSLPGERCPPPSR